MKKLIYLLLSITLFSVSCKKSESQPTDEQKVVNNTNTNTTLPTTFYPYMSGGYYVNGSCWINNIHWGQAGGTNVSVFNQSNITWIDSLNYVVKEQLPITVIDQYSFTFKPYMMVVNNYSVVSGNGLILNDTLRITVNCVTMSTNTCGNPNFTFKGRYKVYP